MAKLALKNVRGSYLNLFKPTLYENTPGTEAYSAQFLISKDDKENIDAVKKAINAAVAEKFPDPAKAKAFLESVKGSKQQFCFRDGDVHRPDDDNYKGMMFLAGRSKQKPKVFAKTPRKADGSENLLNETDGVVYSGCYLNASLDIYVQTGKTSGVRCQLKGVQFAGDGDAFGGGAPASADEFPDLGDGADAPDMTTDMSWDDDL